MNKKFFINTAIVFVVYAALCFLVHGVLLKADYEQIMHMFRPEGECKMFMKYMIIAHLFTAGGLVWLYGKGREMKPFWGQGLRFGFAVACVAVIPIYLIYYSIQPWPQMLVVKQIVLDTAALMITGVIIAKLS